MALPTQPHSPSLQTGYRADRPAWHLLLDWTFSRTPGRTSKDSGWGLAFLLSRHP